MYAGELEAGELETVQLEAVLQLLVQLQVAVLQLLKEFLHLLHGVLQMHSLPSIFRF